MYKWNLFKALKTIWTKRNCGFEIARIGKNYSMGPYNTEETSQFGNAVRWLMRYHPIVWEVVWFFIFKLGGREVDWVDGKRKKYTIFNMMWDTMNLLGYLGGFLILIFVIYLVIYTLFNM